MIAQVANFFAYSAESCAPATSPWAHLLLTCAAKMIAGIPSGQQQKSDTIAITRLLAGA